MTDWWSFGDNLGHRGTGLNLRNVVCPFCESKGHFYIENHTQKKHTTRDKLLNYETLRCGYCGNFNMVFWSGGTTLHDYLMVPPRQNDHRVPSSWPDAVGRYWLQAKRNFTDQNMDATAVMARSAMQLALRDNNATGRTLKDEIESLSERGLLPPIMKEWSDEIRFLGNDAAHPRPEDEPLDPSDVAAAIEFLDYLLQYLYTLPERITTFRKRSTGEDA